MSKPRSRTLIEQMGFFDPDLASPSHDALVLWTAEHLAEFARPMFDAKTNDATKDTPMCAAHRKAHPPPPMEIGKPHFEIPITAGRNDFIVGFVDVVVTVGWPRLGEASYDHKPPKAEWWQQITTLAFEIKPAIRSFGELLRQLRTYQQHQEGLPRNVPHADVRFVVVSPDTRWAETIISQGFYFWECPS